MNMFKAILSEKPGKSDSDSLLYLIAEVNKYERQEQSDKVGMTPISLANKPAKPIPACSGIENQGKTQPYREACKTLGF